MNQLTKTANLINYGDLNYIHAVNYQHMYDAPITLNFGEKHNRTKYILSAGNSDHLEIWQDGIYIYIIAQNNGLNYIGLQEINTETKQISDVFIDSNEIDDDESFAGIMDMDSKEQIKLLTQYISC